MAQLPAFREPLINPDGYPRGNSHPQLVKREDFTDALYGVRDVVSDWSAYAAELKRARPDVNPRVLLVSHDMSEIENITLMALGGVVQALNGTPRYVLINPSNCAELDRVIEEFRPDWLGFNLYTGLTDHVFDWLRGYKLARAKKIFRKDFVSFEKADAALKGLVREGGARGAGYAPVIVGGHYNNHDYATSYARGADFSVRGKGVNLLKDILLGGLEPGIYHDPISYPNLPLFDRAGFYRDTFAFSDRLKKYALSPVKSVLTALGCAYRCTYCYIGSLVENQEQSYEGSGVRPPSIIQDRPLELVLKEGEEIRRLDALYGVSTRAVFDQADISLNNLAWWEALREQWTGRVGIPFYIQARPQMLAGAQGKRRLSMIAQGNLVAGISMAIESGDEHVRRLLLKRHESNDVIQDALKNVKEAMIPLRTQAITGLPVIRPLKKPSTPDIGLVDARGVEHYYDDPMQETLAALHLVCSSGRFGKEDYYWNSLYSPFPGTPLGDYAAECGFHDGRTDSNERAYMFTSEVGLSCFEPPVARKQVAFHRTANFFAHLLNGKDMMTLYLYSRDQFGLEDFARFVHERQSMFQTKKLYSKFGLIPEPAREMLTAFFEHAYPEADDAWFKGVNERLAPYYETLLDGLVLAAKVAARYFDEKSRGVRFNLDLLTRVERNHYYDNSYNMTYLPPRYAAVLRPYIHENRLGLVDRPHASGAIQAPSVEAIDEERLRGE